MYLLNAETEIRWELPPTESPTSLSAFDVRIVDPADNVTYINSAISGGQYTAPTSTESGEISYPFTPTAEGLWTVTLATGSSSSYQVLSSLDLYVFNNATSVSAIQNTPYGIGGTIAVADSGGLLTDTANKLIFADNRFILTETNDVITINLGTIPVSPYQNASDLLAALTGQIGESKLIQSLRDRINLIDGVGTNSVTSRIQDEIDARIAAGAVHETSINNVSATVGSNKASADSSITALVAEDVSIAQSVNTLTATFDASIIAAVNSEAIARADADSAIAATVDTVSTTLDGNTAAVQVVSLSIDGLEAQYTVKVDVNGHVSGFGLATETVDGATVSEFAIVADKFTIAPVGSNSDASAPFFHLTVPETINGVLVPAGTYMKSAFIADATITNAKIGNIIESADGGLSWRITKDGAIEATQIIIRDKDDAVLLDSGGGVIPPSGSLLDPASNLLSGSGVNLMPARFATFEDDTIPLYASQNTRVVTSGGYSGEKCLQLQANTNNDDSWIYLSESDAIPDQYGITVRPDKKYLMSYKVRIDSGHTNQPTQMFLQSNAGDNHSSSPQIDVVNGNWQIISYVFDLSVTNHTGSDKVRVRIDNDGTNGVRMHYDEVMFEEYHGDGTNEEPSTFAIPGDVIATNPKVASIQQEVIDAQSDANTVSDAVDDIDDDLKFSPAEKRAYQIQWAIMTANYNSARSQGEAWSVDVTAMISAYNSANTFLNTAPHNIGANTLTTSTLSGTDLLDKTTDFYDELQLVLMEISDAVLVNHGVADGADVSSPTRCVVLNNEINWDGNRDGDNGGYGYVTGVGPDGQAADVGPFVAYNGYQVGITRDYFRPNTACNGYLIYAGTNNFSGRKYAIGIPTSPQSPNNWTVWYNGIANNIDVNNGQVVIGVVKCSSSTSIQFSAIWGYALSTTNVPMFDGDKTNYGDSRIINTGITMNSNGTLSGGGGGGVTLGGLGTDQYSTGQDKQTLSSNGSLSGGGGAVTLSGLGTDSYTTDQDKQAFSAMPDDPTTPSSSGLYSSSTRFGYYKNGSGWKTYMDNIGNFFLGGSAGSLIWDAAADKLKISGDIILGNSDTLLVGSTTQGIEINGNGNNELRFYDNGIEIASIGDDSSTYDYIGYFGYSTSSRIGVYGESQSNIGILGLSATSRGIYGVSGSGWGVHGTSVSNYGVRATSTTASGLYARVSSTSTSTLQTTAAVDCDTLNDNATPLYMKPRVTAVNPSHIARKGSVVMRSDSVMFTNKDGNNDWFAYNVTNY